MCSLSPPPGHREWRARPALAPLRFDVAGERAAAIVAGARAAGRRKLSEIEALDLLAAYGIPTAPTRLAGGVEEAVRFAAAIGYPVAVKVVSPDIVHKTDVGGVRTDIGTALELREACAEMLDAVTRGKPDAHVAFGSLTDVLLRLSQLALDFPDVQELDVNPLLAFPDGVVAVDARVLLAA